MGRKAIATLAVAGMTALAACGGGGSKPAYCSDVTDLKDAVSGLTDVKIAQNGDSSLKPAIDKVVSSGEKLVADAKSDFPSQTTALNSSITALKTTAQQLADPATQKVALPALPAEIVAVKSAFDGLQSAVKSKCD